MKRPSFRSAGFTLLEVMIAAALGVIVLGVGLAVGAQLQRRALFEEQTMMAQTAGRAAQDNLTATLWRAGTGMGNTPISFFDNDVRYALQVFSDPGSVPFFTDDGKYIPPPPGKESDALRIYWGPSVSSTFLANTGPGKLVSATADANETNYQLTEEAEETLKPVPPLATTSAVFVNAIQYNEKNPTVPTQPPVACAVQVTNVDSGSNRLIAEMGASGTGLLNGVCKSRSNGVWALPGWIALRLEGMAYRVNWKDGFPTLEGLTHGSDTWRVISRDVEQLRVRQAVVDLLNPIAEYRWFPAEVPVMRPALDACTVAQGSAGGICSAEFFTPEYVPGAMTDEVVRDRLRARVRVLEVTLVVRTRRLDRDAVDVGAVDEDGHDRDGYKRRSVTFQVAPRNFGMAGLQPLPPPPTGSGT
ncbi:prepilin-type N-terminal cleavage/methylation domain-containing protein [Corallococcus sp. bb12-1]|uniref:PilW family protein n=1 Tax=Corallococcus sp. bb12-1 TaxID=2996784 RepID=UPI0022709987|nr:prepilin-type N-terminal cleavage/methylation domain-containing protein [Corallococcus sp. bb12-1]MCY1044374.1 prepilin-type N-terminal cleavage/methylation domain-containing protein [Corallococcus sp. bb12-1]